ncbi:hypothetical protein [Sphingomonas nostoxanthinifaciens]|uniref:hypothetical protein n=1 Tax=Sphingomonas nostoxanthinifaciens TaxID=2872652 RepID=UPI001CC217C8|nr:hypothetical protein [Sphingomonas nostoxanthinifaciens]UAK23670.1 hypothetical protein K8P63_14960 [Sphingomonas nostoxanthinifaciens]
MITIGEQKFETTRPDDLDKKILSITGCSAAEVQRQMQGAPLAHSVARALRPFLPVDAPDVTTLSMMIADAGVVSVAGQVATLYAAVPTETAPEAEHAAE